MEIAFIPELAAKLRQQVADIATGALKPDYQSWRHGGYYTNVTYPNGASGCVARHDDGKIWTIACDDRDPVPMFRTRDEATRAEAALVLALWDAALAARERA